MDKVFSVLSNNEEGVASSAVKWQLCIVSIAALILVILLLLGENRNTPLSVETQSRLDAYFLLSSRTDPVLDSQLAEYRELDKPILPEESVSLIRRIHEADKHYRLIQSLSLGDQAEGRFTASFRIDRELTPSFSESLYHAQVSGDYRLEGAVMTLEPDDVVEVIRDASLGSALGVAQQPVTWIVEGTSSLSLTLAYGPEQLSLISDAAKAMREEVSSALNKG